MTHTLAYLIGSLVTGLAWVAHYYWREYQHSVEVLREKERSYQAGYAHAKNLICFKPLAGVGNDGAQRPAGSGNTETL